VLIPIFFNLISQIDHPNDMSSNEQETKRQEAQKAELAFCKVELLEIQDEIFKLLEARRELRPTRELGQNPQLWKKLQEDIGKLNDQAFLVKKSMDTINYSLGPSAPTFTAGHSATSQPAAKAGDRLPADGLIWDHDTDMHRFFEINEAKLISHGTPVESWYKMFGKTTKDDVLMWVKTNILTASPTLSWAEAKEKFQAEYATDDYAFKCRDKMLELTPGSRTATAFLREIESLSVGAQQNLDEPFFKHVLIHKRLPKKLRTALSVKMGKKISSITFAELKLEVAYLDHVDLTNFSPAEKSSSTTTAGKSGGDQHSPPHNCTKCQRGNTGHTTAECRTHPDPSLVAERKAAAKVKADSSAERKKNVVCTRCSQKGHYANESTCPGLPGSSVNVSAISKKVLALKAQHASKQDDTKETLPEFTEDDIAQALFDMHSRAEGQTPSEF